ncbi:hypothetical protein SSX86_022947 [Deinandra increscens subsp. villosa]|uniref:Uncharacterized protein n=1 Tax=Deinandra increscens subsp. villosa TaxID=3103831 RepID=A0AAP0GRM8_9ASTR
MDHDGEVLKDLNVHTYNSKGEYNDDYSQESEEEEMDNNDDSSEEEEMDNNDDQVTENEEATTSAPPPPQANKRGLTRLAKWHAKFEKNGGGKWPLTFDALGMIGGKHRPTFLSFMGNIARSEVGLRYLQWRKVPKEDKNKMWAGIQQLFKIDDCRRGPIMVRLGGLLRSFRRKMFEKHICPNLAKHTVLENVPKMYCAIVTKEDWDKFVAYTKSEEFKAALKSAKEVRAQYVYDNTMGRVQNKEIAASDSSSRAFMWRKERVNKKGEYKTSVVKGVADDIAENETQINAGSVTVEPGTDALTLVLGKEMGGYLKGIGYEVTSRGYWQGAPKRRSKELIEKLEDMINSAHNTPRKQSTSSNSSQRSADKVCYATVSQHIPPSTTAFGQKEMGKKRQITDAAAAATSTAGAS